MHTVRCSAGRLRIEYAVRSCKHSGHSLAKFQSLRLRLFASKCSGSSGLPCWPGLQEYRNRVVDKRRRWGDKDPIYLHSSSNSTSNSDDYSNFIPKSLADWGRKVLLTSQPAVKAEVSHSAWCWWCERLGRPVGVATAPDNPARPDRPQIVPPKLVPGPRDAEIPFNACIMHNLAHIELNAIDLAWDTVVRFSHLKLPEEFYTDFAHVGDDESRHLLWCLQRLQELGCEYGDMPAHDLLWEGAQVTAGDLPGRLVVVPMSQEARGLDSGVRLADRLRGYGDNRSAAVVERIALEEKAHVAVGVWWFRWLCGDSEESIGDAFRHTLMDTCPDLLKGRFNHPAREEVGLKREWYDMETWSPELKSAAQHKLTVAAVARKCAAKSSALLSPEHTSALCTRLATIVDVEATAATSST